MHVIHRKITPVKIIEHFLWRIEIEYYKPFLLVL